MLSPKFNDCFNLFARTLKRADSVTSYKRDCTLFSSVCGERDFLLLDSSDVESFARYLLDKVSSGQMKPRYASAIFARVRSVAVFFSSIDGLAYNNPFEGYHFPVADVSVTAASIPSNAEIDALMSAAREDAELYCILALILKCSLTSGECVSLKKSDIVYSGTDMIIATKSLNKKRFIKVPDDVETLLNDYADAHPHEEDFLFANKNGEQLRIRTLQYRFKKAAAAAGFDNKYSLNDIRNTGIAYMLRCGASGKEVSTFLNVNERWISKYANSVEHMEIVSNDYTNLQIRRNV